MQDRKWMSFAKNTGIVLAVIVAVTQLWDWSTAPEDELVAYVEFGPFLQPPQLNSRFESFAELQDVEKLSELIELDRMLAENDDASTLDTVREALLRVVWLVRERIPASLPYEFRLNGIWRVRIVNESPRSLSQVTITIPDTRYLSVKREGEDPAHRDSGEVISLGTLRARESVSLVSWADREPSAYSARQIKLTHFEGVGDIVVRAPAGPMGQWIDKHWFPVLFVFIWLTLMSLFLVVTEIVGSSKGSQPGPRDEKDEDGRGAEGAA